jgi:tetratricopeptide (TPR) repeat protein
MKNFRLTACLLFCVLTANTQSLPNLAKIKGFYIGEKYTNYIIISQRDDSIFFDGHTNIDECFGCLLSIKDGKLIYTLADGNKPVEMNLTDNNKTLSFSGLSYKKVTLADSIYPYADSLFFYTGLWYLTASRSPNNTYGKVQLLRSAIPYFKKSIALNKDTVNPYLDYGEVYYFLDVPDSAKLIWDKAKKIAPGDKHFPEFYKDLATLYLNDGLKEGQYKDFDGAIKSFRKGIKAFPLDEDLWYNLGGALFTVKKYKEAQEAWRKTLEINPDNANAKRGLDAISTEE